MIDGIPVYEEVSDLDGEERKWLFLQLWDPENHPTTMRTPTGDLMCLACGALETAPSIEEQCNNRDCIRTRITNKLHLAKWVQPGGKYGEASRSAA